MNLSDVRPMPPQVVAKIAATLEARDSCRPGREWWDYSVADSPQGLANARMYYLILARSWPEFFTCWRRGARN